MCEMVSDLSVTEVTLQTLSAILEYRYLTVNQVATMCGHAILALGRYAIDEGLVAKTEPVTVVNIECPCGLVKAEVEVEGHRNRNVGIDGADATQQLALGIVVTVGDHRAVEAEEHGVCTGRNGVGDAPGHRFVALVGYSP